MRNLTKLGALGIIILLGGCSATGGGPVGVGGNPGGVHAGGSGGNGGANQGGATGLGGSLVINLNLGGQSGTTGTGGSTACGTASLCTSTSCGKTVDACGAKIDCGFTNCAESLCGTQTPNVCTPCTPVAVDCAAGNYCGPVTDGCGNFVTCPLICPNQGECCGCGGVPGVCGGSTPDGGLASGGTNNTCIAGSKGCLCDDVGGCAPGLTCTPQTAPNPNLCCSGTDCAGSGTNIGGTCTGTGIATCTPGVTVPAASGSLDHCGYPTTGTTVFNESQILCGIYATGGGKDPAQIQAFFNDEKSLTLGCTTTANPVSAMPSSNTGAVRYPQLGDLTCNDTFGRPMRPTLYVTDITYDPNCKTGDLQSKGTPYDPIAVFGTWKSAINGTPGADPTGGKNYWTLGPGSDPIPAAVTTLCPCTAASCPGSGLTSKGYGTEVKYEAGLISGHSYRLQIIGHDGDQARNGDSAEACAIFCAGTGTCQKMTCADYPGLCGPQSDGCGGFTPSCGACCKPRTCDDYPKSSGPQLDGCGGLTAYCNYVP